MLLSYFLVFFTSFSYANGCFNTPTIDSLPPLILSDIHIVTQDVINRAYLEEYGFILDLIDCNCVSIKDSHDIDIFSNTNKYIKDFSHYIEANSNLSEAEQKYGLWKFLFHVNGHFVKISATQIVNSQVHYYDSYWCKEKLLVDGSYMFLK